MNIPSTQAAGVAAPTQLPGASPTPQSSEGVGFGSALEGVQNSLVEADMLSQQVATGQVSDLSQVTAAAAKAELAVQLTVAFRDRAVQSFQQIMQMQV